jgi:hypothetical protein
VDPHPLEPSPLEPPNPGLMLHPELHEAAAQLGSERQRRLRARQQLLARLSQVRGVAGAACRGKAEWIVKNE